MQMIEIVPRVDCSAVIKFNGAVLSDPKMFNDTCAALEKIANSALILGKSESTSGWYR